ncbi:hypothetical protein WN48_04224 [Eufriesea mexicana]|nr:hypothetical protein WN48_04224 [Eufriesea mexicana]
MESVFDYTKKNMPVSIETRRLPHDSQVSEQQCQTWQQTLAKVLVSEVLIPTFLHLHRQDRYLIDKPPSNIP